MDIERAVEVLRSAPSYHHYYTEHGLEHANRVWQILENRFFGSLRPQLPKFSRDILQCAVYLHDIGMANPKTSTNTGGVPDPEDLERIRENHEILSEEFVVENARDLHLDQDTADVVGLLCRSHRRRHYVRDVFPESVVPVNGEDVRVQLLSALLKVADALDADRRRASELESTFFIHLPQEHQWYWQACELVQGVGVVDTHKLRLRSRRLRVRERREAEGILERKAADIFHELFLVMPFLSQAGIPYTMVEVLIRDHTGRNERVFPVWEQWWHSEIKPGEMADSELQPIAEKLTGFVRPPIFTSDICAALECVRNTGYPVPPTPRSDGDILRTHYPISSPPCSDSFVEALRGAQARIELFARDGRAFPGEAKRILGEKLLGRPTVKVVLLLLDPAVLHQVEGEKQNLSLDDAQKKVELAKAEWATWWQDLLASAQLDPEQRDALEECFSVRFVTDQAYAHLSGGAIVDDQLVRLNVHREGESPMRGTMVHCSESSNLALLLRPYVEAVYASSYEWSPGDLQNEGES